MAEWWQYLKGRPFYWVLDGSDPAASYYMLQYVVERPDAARGVKAARLALQESPIVARLKETLTASSSSAWSADYQGASWTLRRLAEWGYPGNDEKVATALDALLSANGNSTHPYGDVLLLHTASAFGFYADERVQSLSEKVLKQLTALKGVRQDPHLLVLVAMALAALPSEAVSRTNVALLESAFAALNPADVPAFAAYAYPTYDTPDAITVVESALRLGMRGTWLAAWIEQIVAAQDEQGLWRAQRVHTDDAAPNTPNRWLSARALYGLRAYYGD